MALRLESLNCQLIHSTERHWRKDSSMASRSGWWQMVQRRWWRSRSGAESPSRRPCVLLSILLFIVTTLSVNIIAQNGADFKVQYQEKDGLKGKGMGEGRVTRG